MQYNWSQYVCEWVIKGPPEHMGTGKQKAMKTLLEYTWLDMTHFLWKDPLGQTFLKNVIYCKGQF